MQVSKPKPPATHITAYQRMPDGSQRSKTTTFYGADPETVIDEFTEFIKSKFGDDDSAPAPSPHLEESTARPLAEQAKEGE